MARNAFSYRVTVVVGVALSTIATAGTAQTPASAAAAATPTAVAKNDYAKAANWLCRPGRKDACKVDLTTTVVAADGKLTRERFAADPKAPIDCFYVYPTVSTDAQGNSDMVAGSEEKFVVSSQLSRFAARCRLYAPLYRQITLTSLRATMSGKPIPADPALGYGDVVDAWNHYLAHDNKGRGVVLIGHSQGARVLSDLVQKEIEGKPVQARMISALLIGYTVGVPKGADVGGTFKQIPLCRSATQTGCIVTYASFRATAPPPATSRFAHAANGLVAGCTNPAALGGGSGDLHAYLRSSAKGFTSSAEPGPWVKGAKPLTTGFASVPGLLGAECVSNDKGSYLAVTVHADPADPRTDEIVGDVVANGAVQADWGLHVIDVNLLLGNLIDLVGQQAQAYLAATKH
jgi:Protein of unknown function (DUF3089)